MAGYDSVNSHQNKQDKAGENTQEDQPNDGNQPQEIDNPGTVPTETTTLSSDDNDYESVSENSLGDGLVSTSMEPKEPPSLSSPTTALESQKDSGIDSEKPKQALKQVGKSLE
ncbi:uncharacterized protein ZK546.14-like [Frankliniella occidentalis]|uniref:Uncharacterized protein ZK546.14-like n=1 Tax=Frankliniella occidentalis TaxID=133901 RepID=A0A9C6U4F1_FRAOC|nr:uncharacterized protein ZK546.14-like [Frankliniella occidentalis]